MLVLERKLGERIRVGKDIWVHLVDILDDGVVLIGIDAPKEINILRDELIRDEFTFRKYKEEKCKTPRRGTRA